MITFPFPPDFMWGAATSAFQIEGGASSDGRGPSVWDHMAATQPELFHERHTPAVAADFYHRYPDDIAQMKELGLNSFRLSLSWSRILPQGRGAVNKPGLDFYDRLVDTLLAQGIQPLVDLYHWDLPWALAQGGGFNNPGIVADFEHYARVCFERLGDRVSCWSTLNEPTVLSGFNPFDPANDDEAQLRRWQMHVLLMHFAAVRAYRGMGLSGKIGAVMAYVPVYPASLSKEDQTAARLRQHLVTNSWLDPMLKGTYPEELAQHPDMAAILPPDLQARIQEAFSPMDFVGVNYYTTSMVGHKPGAFLESDVVKPFAGQSESLKTVYAPGLYDSLNYLRQRYGDVELYITENGYATDREKPLGAGLEDPARIDFIREHLREVVRCLQAGIKVRGYFYWSLFDTFENTSAYRYCFGLLQVDFKTLQRSPRQSWYYYQKCIARNTVVP